MYHCCNFNHNDIWYLYDNKDFFDRRLYVGICPDCKKDVIMLIEVRKTDSKPFVDMQEADKALKTMKHFENQINYTESDAFCPKGKPCGWTYCENLITKVNRVDFYGQRETIKLRV